ncbi:hypothetical protein M3Y99_00238100 [Aphelenchoides fujianensis]|nr:hypothetical protein M3Y99_00238100 [Aphelenchoides fujianensis]
MGLEYLRSFHGILTAIIVLCSSFSLFVGHFVWHNGDVFFLFVLGAWPLVTMVLVFILAVWITSMVMLMAQTLGKDLMEQLGKLKALSLILIIHAVCAILICAAAVAESFYVSRAAPDYFYFPRFIMVMIACWIMLVATLGQIIFIAFQ